MITQQHVQQNHQRKVFQTKRIIFAHCCAFHIFIEHKSTDSNITQKETKLSKCWLPFEQLFLIDNDIDESIR